MNYLKFYNGGAIFNLPNSLEFDKNVSDPFAYKGTQLSLNYGLTLSNTIVNPYDPNLVKNFHNESGVIRKAAGTDTEASNSDKTFPEQQKKTQGISKEGAQKLGMGMEAAMMATQMADNAAFGDKNFGTQSAAIDAGVHAASSALMKSGNPYAILAGVGLEGANFLTKAGGLTVKGYDVNIDNSGYGNLGHKDSSSSRDFGAMIGLGGLNPTAMTRKLTKRNEEAQMALKAGNISDQIQFEQEARMNSVDDVIRQNEIALQGGVDTSLLAAKKGGKIIRKAQNGAKLENIEVSEEKSVIPSGAMHKNKNNLDLEDITKKGIPVITVEDDSATTFNDIKGQEDTLVQHAEVEAAEIIFNKELTDYIEEMRKKWHESKDLDICLEAGMRLAKEIVENTEDNTDVTEKSMEAIEHEGN